MKQYLIYVQQLVPEFTSINFEKVPREQNTKANILCKMSASEPIDETWTEFLSEKNIGKDIFMADVIKDWTTSICYYST